SALMTLIPDPAPSGGGSAVTQAILVPSGDHAGSYSCSALLVRFVALVPSGLTVQMSPPWTKAILPFWPGKVAWAGAARLSSTKTTVATAILTRAATPYPLSAPSQPYPLIPLPPRPSSQPRRFIAQQVKPGSWSVLDRRHRELVGSDDKRHERAEQRAAALNAAHARLRVEG